MGYECPDSELEKFVRTATPVASRTTTPASSVNSSRSQSPAKKGKGKRRASSSSEGTSDSDSTVVGSDDDSESSSTRTSVSGSAKGSSRSRSNSDASFSLVKEKNKKAIRKAVKKSKSSAQQASTDMDVEITQASSSTAPAAPAQSAQGPATTPTPVATDRASPRPGAKPSAPPKAKTPPPIFLRKGANFVKISADCTRLHINYSKAVRVADDGIKIICPNVETFRSLNKYLVDNKVQFHTYALEEERKIKAVIRGIPADFALDDIKNDLCGQGFPVHSVHRMTRRDGSPLWMVLAILPRTDDAKKIFNSLRVVCGLSGIRVEAPFKKGGPGQCHRCKNMDAAAGVTGPRCVKCLVPHWTKVPAHSGVAGETLLPNYKAPSPPRPWIWRISRRSRRGKDNSGCQFPPRPRTLLQPVGEESAPEGRTGTIEGARPPRSPAPLPATATAGPSSFGDDIQTVMAVLRAVSSSEIAEFAGGRRKPKNLKLLSFNANGLQKNIPELTNCMSEYGIDIALIQETFLKPNRPRACAIAGYVHTNGRDVR
ncbi:Nucleic-acid-binding protein from transposon X-element [Eumeta japonica]|uniref:Nucleic-acid-binding protein from transposon X-element n=1 Tax=Eumeta variegata TaxID=151549 RepID=A0A4C1YPL4_EUMVA|nr:Nucleic-acid-binding protein from transposon X-element [Eumeta japonica]